MGIKTVKGETGLKRKQEDRTRGNEERKKGIRERRKERKAKSRRRKVRDVGGIRARKVGKKRIK